MGFAVGMAVGTTVDVAAGFAIGVAVGAAEGVTMGLGDGMSVGAAVSVEACDAVGAAVGLFDAGRTARVTERLAPFAVYCSVVFPSFSPVTCLPLIEARDESLIVQTTSSTSPTRALPMTR